MTFILFCTFDWCQRGSEVVQMMEEDLVTVRARRNTHYVTVCFAAHSFKRMGFLKQLNHKEKRNIYLCIFPQILSIFLC